jgi:ABC-type transporter Mla subunit MlaD
MAKQQSLLSLYEDFLKNYTFIYYPTTDWTHALSPTLNFGCNVKDVDVEQHVLDEVGSYGSQLNRVLDVLSVLVADLDRSTLTPQEQQFVDKFEELASRADDAARNFLGKRRHGVTHADINHMIAALRTLQRTNKPHYDELVAQIYTALPRPGDPS